MAVAAMMGLIGFCRIADKMANANDPHTITDTDQLA